jgi:hypothetical protein
MTTLRFHEEVMQIRPNQPVTTVVRNVHVQGGVGTKTLTILRGSKTIRNKKTRIPRKTLCALGLCSPADKKPRRRTQKKGWKSKRQKGTRRNK